jgi:molybdate-binding protein
LEDESLVALRARPLGEGYRRFLKGEVIAAAMHFHDRGDPDRDANRDRIAREPLLYDAVHLGFAAREQGLVLAAGNPLGLDGFRAASARQARFLLRPEGAGARQLLLALLERERMVLGGLRAVEVAVTGVGLAEGVRSGRGDCGIATRAVAAAAGLECVPLCCERFDILVRQRDYFRPPLQGFFTLLRSSLFAERAKQLGGLDVAAAGEVRFAP